MKMNRYKISYTYRPVGDHNQVSSQIYVSAPSVQGAAACGYKEILRRLGGDYYLIELYAPVEVGPPPPPPPKPIKEETMLEIVSCSREIDHPIISKIWALLRINFAEKSISWKTGFSVLGMGHVLTYASPETPMSAIDVHTFVNHILTDTEKEARSVCSSL